MGRVVSVDAHKASFTYVLREGRRRLQGPSRRKNTVDEVRALARKFPGATIVIEACGPHEWMHDVLVKEGAKPFVCRPPRREAGDAKNDSNDADLLGKDFLADRLKQVYVPPPDIRLLREVVRQRCFLVAQRTAVTNRIKHELNRWNIPNEELDKTRDAITKQLPHLMSSFAILDTLDREISTLTKRIHEESEHIPPVKRLQSIPGFGAIVSMAYYVELGDITRFENAHAVTKYIGLDPKWRQSGDTRVDQHQISKTGRPLLRSLLTQAAWAHVTHAKESAFTKDYERFLERGIPKHKAIVAVERKLAEAAYAVWKHDKDFTLTRPATTAPGRPQ